MAYISSSQKGLEENRASVVEKMTVILTGGGRGHIPCFFFFSPKYFRFLPFALCIHRDSEENETYKGSIENTVWPEDPRMMQSRTFLRACGQEVLGETLSDMKGQAGKLTIQR